MTPLFRRAFTLVELLVVITIIVVLLALLTPALDQAIYQAELAVCGAQIKGIVGGTTIYAVDHGRRYPNRPAFNEQTIYVRYANKGGNYDLREIIKGHVPPDHLTCPLSGNVKLTEGDADSHVYGSYDYWAGWRYTMAGTTEAGMRKVGDRFTWTTGYGSTAPIQYRFNLLVSDRDVIGYSAQTQSTHPDTDGLLSHLNVQNGGNPWGAQVGPANSGGKITIAMWRMLSHARGSVDRNFGAEDGGVFRIADQIVQPNGEPDERIVPAPMYSNGTLWSTDGSAGYYTALPRP